MVTQEQAASVREFHFEGRGPCTTKVERWRANGAIKTWVTRPGEFRLPIKWGLRSYDYLTHENADQFHVASECPAGQS